MRNLQLRCTSGMPASARPFRVDPLSPLICPALGYLRCARLNGVTRESVDGGPLKCFSGLQRATAGNAARRVVCRTADEYRKENTRTKEKERKKKQRGWGGSELCNSETSAVYAFAILQLYGSTIVSPYSLPCSVLEKLLRITLFCFCYLILNWNKRIDT